MSFEHALEVENLSKQYSIYKSPARAIGALLFGARAGDDRVDALRPVSFKVRRGGSLGVIGQNGSGKSTLLQLITGILQPTTGEIKVNGKIAALLELGAGFNPEFTGRENARLNAAILGIGGREFDLLLPKIEAFADIGRFIDIPVKKYSSGMFVRLAFAIQACVEPDILIVDEALAVGDVFFRLKCYERLEKLRRNGCTVILVTHSMPDVLQFCDDALLLHEGRALFHGDPAEAVNRYMALGKQTKERARPSTSAGVPNHQAAREYASNAAPATDCLAWPEAASVDLSSVEQTGDSKARCLRAAILDDDGKGRNLFRQFERLFIHVEFEALIDLDAPVVGIVIRTDRGPVVYGINSGQARAKVPGHIREGELIRAVFDFELSVGLGDYVIDLGFATWPSDLLVNESRVSMAELEAESARHCVVSAGLNFTVLARGNLGFAAQPFYGMADLHGKVRLSIVEKEREEASAHRLADAIQGANGVEEDL